MLVGSVFYFWGRHYSYNPIYPEIPLEWSSLAVTSMTILVGIAFAGVCDLILRDDKEPEVKRNLKTLSVETKKDFNSLMENSAGLVEWLHRETPVERPDYDYFDLKVYARRIVGILRKSPLKTIAIVGPYGCGKSSILNMIDFYLLEKESDKLAHSSKEEGVQLRKILTLPCV